MPFNGNVKACCRHSLAHIGTKNNQKSLNDLNKVLLDSSIIEAKVELVTRFLNFKDNMASFNQEEEGRKIEIQEVNEGHEEPERTSEDVSAGCLVSEKEDTRIL